MAKGQIFGHLSVCFCLRKKCRKTVSRGTRTFLTFFRYEYEIYDKGPNSWTFVSSDIGHREWLIFLALCQYFNSVIWYLYELPIGFTRWFSDKGPNWQMAKLTNGQTDKWPNWQRAKLTNGQTDKGPNENWLTNVQMAFGPLSIWPFVIYTGKGG